ncbi:ABC transporter ATP-binding protein [Hirschia litorea]|uniref:ABC transporter ATP-binding protein n=1 Tax=Hirschia litorea TaxID=1199156 RepID=A0ABW2IIX4_9PROT
MAKPKNNLLPRFASDWMAKHWRLFALGALFSAITALAVASYGLMVKTGLDWLSATEHGEGVVNIPFLNIGLPSNTMMWLLPCAVIGFATIRSVSLYIQTILNNSAVQLGLVSIQDALFSRLIEGDYARLTAAASGEFVSQFINDMNLVREAALRVATNLIKGVLTIIACVATMFWYDWALALMVLVVYPIAFAPVVQIGNRLRKVSKAAQQQTGEMTALLNEGFQGGRTSKAFNLEDYQNARAHAGFLERARLYLKVLRSKALVDPLLEIVGGAALAGVFAFTGWRIMNGEATVGDFGGFIAAIGAASPEVRALGTLNSVANEGLAALERIYAVLDAPDKVADKPDAIELSESRGAIAFEGVEFGYGDQGVLNGLTFHAEPGQTIALVGPSGAGKSTVFNLALRLYDVSGGKIILDGHDIRDVQRKSLRSQMSLVAQDAFLFDDTLRANIALGRMDASEAEITAALDAAACDFVYDLPQGLDTQAGEGGRNLSGGQRQRIAIARAILRDAPILLLDEATSALDASSEAKVQAALEQLSKGRTTLIIAHRLSTVRSADKIFVLDKGRVVEEGSHETLMQKNAVYADLVKLQLSE